MRKLAIIKLLQESNNTFLYIPIIFCLGCFTSILNQEIFVNKISIIIFLIFLLILFNYLNRYSLISLVTTIMIIFCCGIIYCIIYEKFFLNYTNITKKLYVEGYGTISNITNSKTNKKIEIITLSNLDLFIPKPKAKNINNEAKKFDFINDKNLLDIDRKFIELNNSYQNIDSKEYDDKRKIINPPKKIVLILNNNINKIEINDKIKFRALIKERNNKEFIDDFDFNYDRKIKDLGGFGFAVGNVEIVEKSMVNNIDKWFLKLRKKITDKIFNVLDEDKAGIAIGLLIGDQDKISKTTLNNIRDSGLSHILTISGFHLSLASAIFFVTVRFLLASFEKISLNYDIRKISAILAIISSYFYLKIANSPLPAQRSFVIIFLIMLSFLIERKFDGKRALFTSLLIITIGNPYSLFNLSFQLSFISILTLLIFYEFNNQSKYENDKVLKEVSPLFLSIVKIIRYIFKTIILSILVQITTLPFLLNSFKSAGILGFIANITAIPLAGFIIMPLGFLSLLLMPLNLEKITLELMGNAIYIFEYNAQIIADLKYAVLKTSTLPDKELFIATIAILLFSITNNFKLRIFLTIVFFLTFISLKNNTKPIISIPNNQKFVTIYDQEDGLFFLDNLKPSKQLDSWLKYFEVGNFRIINNCQKNHQEKLCKNCQKEFCNISYKDKKILVIKKRIDLNIACNNNFFNQFDLIINLTKKYILPKCLDQSSTKMIIDNIDFYNKGGHFIFLNKQNKLQLKTVE